MGMTITEKILALHSNESHIVPGQIINAQLDVILANEITGSLAIELLESNGVNYIHNPDNIILIPDHFSPAKDVDSAKQADIIRRFALKHKIKHFYEVGRAGIQHCFIPEQGLVAPGDLIIGADSHTCTHGALGAFATGVGSTDAAIGMATGKLWLRVPQSIKFILYGKPKNPYVSAKDYILYIIGQIGVDGAQYKAMEFTGEAIDSLSMSGRFTITNMAIEAGAKNGIIAPDEKTIKYISNRVKRSWITLRSDADAKYEDVIEIDVTNLEPQIAFPHLPSNTKPVSAGQNIKLDQVVIGSCTNGSLEDLKIAAKILNGRKINSNLRTIIIPGTQKVYLQAVQQGLIQKFIESECIVCPPTCGPCFGGHMGILSKGERALSTTNRNFIGRMGHVESEVYLSNVAVAAASAIKGYITDPKEVE